MKKIIALTLTTLLALGGLGAAVTATAATQTAPQAEEAATEQSNLYLVPGTYVEEGATVKNIVPSGATALTDEDCAAIFTENAYLCNLSEGDALPVPESTRTDKDGKDYKFNGWWTIVDATVTYYDKVPALTENTFLYADWRADLSQRKDPVIPDESTIVKPSHYMSIKRAKTGEEETVVLRVSGTDVVSSESLGYGRPVQLYNGWFELSPEDVITVYTTGLTESQEAEVAPLDVTGRKITLENSGDGGNVTGSFLNASTDGDIPTLTYKKALKTRHYRIYIKFDFKGANMNVYMEPMD